MIREKGETLIPINTISCKYLTLGPRQAYRTNSRIYENAAIDLIVGTGI